MNRRCACAPAPRLAVARGAGVAAAVALLAAAVAIVGVGSGPHADAASSAGPAPAAADIAQNHAPGVARPAAPSGTASTTVGRGGDTLQLSATPSRGLAAYGAEIEVRGSGFDDSADLWIAVCQDDGIAPTSLAHCVGGAIPDGNGTSAWAVITSAKQPPYAGPVMGKWHGKGSFDVTLQIPAAAGQDADCLSSSCSVYTRSSDNADRSQDARVPVKFAQTTTSSGAGGGEATTQTVGAVATTVSPDSVAETSVAAGTQQVVTFSGYNPGEAVDVTLYSDPITLPVAKADGRGVVTVSFVVPTDLPPGEHLVQAVGRQSGRVGIAQFEVGAATTETSATDTTATTLDSTTLDTATETTDAGGLVAPDETAQSGPNSSSETVPSSSTADTATDVSEAAAGAVTSSDGSASGGANRLLWLWIVLLALVLIGAAAGLVVLLRRRRDREDDQALQPVDEVLPQPGWAAYQDPTDRAGWPIHATDPTGSAGVAGAPGATTAADLHPATPWQSDPGPATEEWVPDPGPETQEWSPEPRDDRPTSGRHRSE